ncbi:hypothetical protein LshimejAT787_0506990 [Lyophyllum shimeji]|uniref:Uncharacterized protein n=1 Tax=Lyophyllum shimeji TaxID=47721 RepID=A0A9P3PNU9_LYOSH|nr:hypothetical protein LshimejAT787_0506990 [Lyophyllum shimeji]
MAEIAEGIYEIYYNGTSGQRPLGVASVDGGDPQVVELLPGSIAPLWTVTKVADGIFTFTVNGAYASPSGSFVAPASTAYGWRVVNTGGNTFTYVMHAPTRSRAWARDLLSLF